MGRWGGATMMWVCMVLEVEEEGEEEEVVMRR
jgi:hypothetical protein